MFELADYLGFTVALLGGVFAGRRMRPRPPEPIKPVCSCKHGYGQHTDGRSCRAKELTVYDQYNSKRLQPCACSRYDGPDPVIFGLEG